MSPQTHLYKVPLDGELCIAYLKMLVKDSKLDHVWQRPINVVFLYAEGGQELLSELSVGRLSNGKEDITSSKRNEFLNLLN